MEKFTNCTTRHTALYKPHTLYINNNIKISIVYYSVHGDLVALAQDISGNNYSIYKTVSPYGNTGFIAVPENADHIKGFYPWL